MDMDSNTSNDDLLLQQFFGEAARQQVADNGFTQRVMQRLPKRAKRVDWFSRLWTAGCIAVFVVLFVVFRGWELLAVHFEVLLRTLLAQSFSVDLSMLAAVLFGLLFVGVGEAVSRA